MDPKSIAASWTFEQNYDSVKVRYRITEFRRNAGVLRLKDWCANDEVEALSDSALSAQSRSETILLATGDTISFYREFLWFNPFNNGRMPDNYRSTDSLIFAVELIDAATHVRLALLDSLGAYPRSTFGTPLLHGTRPIMAITRWETPSELAGDSVYLRISLSAKGNGLSNFRRWGQLTSEYSQQLADSAWIVYLQDYGGGLGKQSVSAAGSSFSNAVTLDVLPIPTSGPVEIAFAAPSGANRQIIAVYDETGNLEFLPFISGADERRRSVRYTFPRAGSYFVVSIIDGVSVKSRAVTVVK
jgi:hypothetical protein